MNQTWNETTPADTDLISSGDDEIRNLKQAIRERLDVEHVFTSGNEANVGEHAAGFITEAKGYIGASAVTNANIKSATATPAASSIPIADTSGQLNDGWGRVSYIPCATFVAASGVGDSLITTILTLKTITAITLPTLSASGVAIIDIPLATYLSQAMSGTEQLWITGNYSGTHYGNPYLPGVATDAEILMRCVYRGTGGSVSFVVYATGIPNGATVSVAKTTDMPVRCEVVTW